MHQLAARRTLWILALLALFPLAGCGDDGVPTKRVRGTLTFKGGPPPKEGGILLTPLEAAPGLPRREARGEFDTSGKFSLTTFDKGDGIIPGKYAVKITCWRVTPTLATSDTANYVPSSFKPVVTIDADAGEPVEITIDVPVLQEK
jgi:hypothetical protein